MSTPPKCTPPVDLLGIKIVYCENGQKKEKWVNLETVHAISWCVGVIKKKAKGTGNPHGPKLPSGAAPTGCSKEHDIASGGALMCWWDGSQWQCGEA